MKPPKGWRLSRPVRKGNEVFVTVSLPDDFNAALDRLVADVEAGAMTREEALTSAYAMVSLHTR